MRIVSWGHAVFAATMIGLGILGLVKGDFPPIWQSVPDDLPGRVALVYLCIFISLACGIGLLWRRTAAVAARVLLVSFLLWLLLFKARFILLAPTEEVSYQTCGETAVFVAAAWILYAWFATGFATGDKGVRIARILYGLALIAFGLSHFFYVELTAPLIPRWLGVPTFWAYFTGCTYLAAGVSVLVNVYARLAAALSALQIALFLPLVWLPLIAKGTMSPFQWGEVVVSVALMAAAWVVADSYRTSVCGPGARPHG